MDQSRRRVLQLAAAASVPLAGCSSGGDGTDTATETPADGDGSPADSGGKPAQEVYPDYRWSTLEGVDPVATDTIAMSASRFEPLVTAVEPGTEVTVTNEDSYQHTFTVPKLGIDETLAGGASTTIPVEQTGTYDYVCAVHPPAMLGRLVVTTDPPSATASDGETPTETDTPTPTGGAGNVVKMANALAYEPVRLSVETGTTVTWENEGTAHTVTSARFHDVAEDWSMDVTLDTGESTSHTFEGAGVYEYYCAIHGKGTMCGVVLVGGATLDKSLPCE